MIITFYAITDDPKKVAKTLPPGTALTGTLQEDTDLYTPTFTLEESLTTARLFNYCYIADFGRYYFLDPPTQETAGLVRFKAHCDVLMSFSSQYLSLFATVERNENRANGYLIDPEYKAVAYEEIITKEFPNAMTNDSIILLTVGTNAED